MTHSGAEPVPSGLEFHDFGWRPAGRSRRVLRDLELSVAPGERVLLAGPSGAGKSTLLRAAAGVLDPRNDGELTGKVLVDGADAADRQVPVGLVLQRPADGIVADRVGRDVAFGPENLALSRAEIWQRVCAALELVGFPYGIDTPTGSLSGGELQRLALAGALALQPGLLLLDEPTALLDAGAAAVLRSAVLRVVEQTGATLVVVEHRLEPWLDHVDRVVVLASDGTLLCDGPPAHVLERNSAQLTDAGLWVPGLGAPVPLAFPSPAAALPTEAALPAACPVVEAQGLTVRLRSRGLRDRRERLALDSVDADVVGGVVTAFTGPSGAGKSTLLGALGGLIQPSGGQVRAVPALAGGLDRRPHRWSSLELAARVGWVPQDPEHGFVTHRVVDEVRLTADRLGRGVDAEELLHLLSLGHLREANPYRLSGGEQRRLSLLAGLAHRPAVALLDEPTVGQDRHTWAAVAGMIASLAAGGAAVGVATHDRSLTATVANRERALAHGSMVAVP